MKTYWNNILNTVTVKTPLESTNIMLNSWAVYQTIVCRLFARSGFYQSGGAIGFRDQLQDTLGLKYINPQYLKNQILKHARHQFIKGDVQHWWHEETKRGIRTRFSDDLLWLPYAVCEYIEFTGDVSILNLEEPYVDGHILEDGVDEKYDVYYSTEIKESILIHCIKAIDKSLDFGQNNLPKMGSGDWNDGMSTVGNKGIGESVWLGFFLYNILDRFVKILQDNVGVHICAQNEEETIQKYNTAKETLKKSLNTIAWDGRWYKRAFADNGDILGTMANEECRIDSISQTWSIISNAGDNDKKYISLESLETHLVDRDNGIIKLLDPAFDKSKLEPGYIKAYLPGVRENGGQYTHAAVWAIIAFAMLGFGDKAGEYFRMINPIEHARTKEAANKYKVEPYVLPGDVYSAGNLAGRGGWTWYTGSSSWLYKAGIEYILGLKIERGILRIEPCIPTDWKEYSIKYRYKDTIYNISVKNPNGKNSGCDKFIVNGVEIEEKELRLVDDKRGYSVEVIM